MADPSIAAQEALYAMLTAGSPALAVYDAVPQNAAYPYVVISTQQQVPDDPLATRRDERTFYLSVWSTYKGQREVLSILAEIDALLHRQRAAMSSGRMVRCFVTRKLTQREPDNATYMGQVTVRMITEH